MRAIWVGAAVSMAITAEASAQRSAQCNAPAAEPIVHVQLPGNPFEPIPTPDGCWIFVSLPARDSAKVAVLRRSAGEVTIERVVRVPGAPTGMVLTHDGKTLIAAAADRVLFLDAGRLISGQGDPLVGTISDSTAAGRVYINVTADDRTVFVSDEQSSTISVIDFAKAQRSGFDRSAIIGKIPVGRAPIALTFSLDERYLFTTSQAAPASYNWPITCRPEGSDTLPPNHTKGAILVVDVARAKTNPAAAVVGAVAAGCNPVRLVLSPKGDRAYVSARGQHELLVFDTQKLIADSARALIAAIPVGTAPVGVAVVNGGKTVLATSSNRFGGGADDRQFLTVVDAARVGEGRAAVVGRIPAGAFPREMRLTSDQRTLLHFASRTLQIIDLARLPVQ
jgi:DNA-binding beta-propeller fold protein YncE